MRFICCCASLCKVGNAVRLLHFLLTILVFYVLTASKPTGELTSHVTGKHNYESLVLDLHAAWLSKNGYFFAVLSLTIISSIFYLLASLVDPGYLPKADFSQDILASFSATSKKQQNHKVMMESG